MEAKNWVSLRRIGPVGIRSGYWLKIPQLNPFATAHDKMEIVVANSSDIASPNCRYEHGFICQAVTVKITVILLRQTINEMTANGLSTLNIFYFTVFYAAKIMLR